jgi:hypothetical protein
MAWHLVAHKQVQVNEGDWDVNTHIDVRRGDTLLFSAWGQIWARVWLLETTTPAVGATAITTRSSRSRRAGAEARPRPTVRHHYTSFFWRWRREF